MPSLKDMRGKAKEAGLMKLGKFIANRTFCDQNLSSDIMPLRDDLLVSGGCF
jgi:hypothetical protein